MSDRFQNAQEMVDLERYPILDDGARRERVLAESRQQLADRGCCELPGFVRAEAIAEMVRESGVMAPDAYWSQVQGNAYLEPADPTLPEDHAKRMEDTTALAAVAYDQIPLQSLIRRFYEWDPLMNFLGHILGHERLYRYADPMGALNLAVMKKGDYLRWHFDQTDFVTSLAIQSAEKGGDFEFVPMIRTRSAENFEAVRKVLKGSREGVQRIPMVPGTLVLFQGRHSLHRVSPIEGERLRHVALLGYDTKPGVTSTPYLQKLRYGRLSQAAS